MKDLRNRESNRAGVIEAYKKGERPVTICEQYPMVSRQTIYRWIKAFVQQQRTGFKPREASPIKQEYLAQVLQLHRLGLNYEAIHRSIPKVSAETIRRWIKGSTQITNAGKMEKKKDPQPKPLEKQVKTEDIALMSKEQLTSHYCRIQAELYETKARLLLAETMIDVAEEQFGITIRKKPGAK